MTIPVVNFNKLAYVPGSGEDYWGAIRNTAVQKYGRDVMRKINEYKKLYSNKLYLVSYTEILLLDCNSLGLYYHRYFYRKIT